jgi:hypothetical protein
MKMRRVKKKLKVMKLNPNHKLIMMMMMKRRLMAQSQPIFQVTEATP